METNTMKVGYHLVRNATSTAEKAPYFGVAVPVGSLAYGNILQRMLDRGTYMTRATAQYCLNEFYEYAAKVIADDIVRINMGAVSIYPMIGGPFDSEDDTYREPRNTLYIGATLSQELRNAVTGLVPENLVGIAIGTVQITSVMDLASETYHLIDGLKEFRIVGIDLTVPDGEDESLALVAADGVTKVADITVVSTEDGQRIVCTLASAVPAGTYYVRLVSHGLDPTAPIVTALHKVAVKAGAIPPTPEFTFTGVSTSGGPMGLVNYSQSIQLHGTGLVEEATIEAKPTDSAGEFFAVPGGFMDFDSDELIRLDSEVQVGDMTLWDYLTQTVGISSQHNSVTFRITQDGESKTASATVNFE